MSLIKSSVCVLFSNIIGKMTPHHWIYNKKGEEKAR